MPIGERIRQARRASGMSLRDLGAKARLSAQAISKYERNLDTPGSEALLHLSEALRVSTDYFFRPSDVKLSMTARRCMASLSSRAETRVLSQAREALERRFEIEDLFPGRIERLPLPGKDLPIIEHPEQVEASACAIRDEWGLGLDPIANLTVTLEDHGLRAVIIEGPPSFDACVVWCDSVDCPVVVVREGVPGDRQRFSMAHELGHLLLRFARIVDQEAACNRFAGAFLVPRERVIAELGNRRATLGIRELGLLKFKYGLSMQSWIHRASETGVIAESTAKGLLGEFRRRGWRVTEPGQPVPPEEPVRARLLTERALAEGLISRSRARELLGSARADGV